PERHQWSTRAGRGGARAGRRRRADTVGLTMRVAPHSAERRRIHVAGGVQGVGFRPFVHRLAAEGGLSGFVVNDGDGVLTESGATGGARPRFTDPLRKAPPGAGGVDSAATAVVPATGEQDFRIKASSAGSGRALIPADLATCVDCLAELYDPADRRY